MVALLKLNGWINELKKYNIQNNKYHDSKNNSLTNIKFQSNESF